MVLAAAAGIQERSGNEAGRRGLVTMATFRFQTEAVLHHSPPFRAVRPRALAISARSPVNDQVRHFMRDGIAQKIIEILQQQLLVDTQAGAAITINPGLACTATAQRKVNRGPGQVNAIIIAGTIFCLTHDGFSFTQEFYIFWFVGHVYRVDRGLCRCKVLISSRAG